MRILVNFKNIKKIKNNNKVKVYKILYNIIKEIYGKTIIWVQLIYHNYFLFDYIIIKTIF